MYQLQTEKSFDAAHFLKGYDGKCKNIHGHRWRVVATVQSETLIEDGPTAGMLTDFGDLKSDLGKLTKALDHALLVEEGSLKEATLAALLDEEFKLVTLPFRTTAENMSRYFYEALGEMGYDVVQVMVYETPSNCAIYNGGEAIVRV